MPKPDEQIDRIVGEVLARLGTSAPSRSSRPAPIPAAGALSPGELLIDDKVVSAATLQNRLSGVQRVMVSARAVVTPSARDLLKENNVSLVRTLKAAAASSVELLLAKLDSRFDSAGLIRTLQNRGVAVQQMATAEGVKSIETIAHEISQRGKLGVILTGSVATALCAANRHRGVRAAVASNRGELESAIREIGANVLVIDITRRSTLEVERMVSAFVATPQRECPAGLKSILE
jgi:ribose 5-phosphate isomerase RpiB